MIEWISNWLQNIIIIVLLATFVDMLLPSSGMQKYARMVLGFLVILTILTPIINIFSDLSIDDAITKLEEEAFPIEGKELNQKVSLESEKLKQENKNKMIEQVEAKMVLDAREIFREKSIPFEIQSLSIEADSVGQEWKINNVTLFLTDEEQTVGTEKVDGVNEIDSIQIATISLDNNISDPEPNKTFDDDLTNNIKTILSNEWGFSKEIIVVNYQ